MSRALAGLADYHTHSRFSDGEGELSDLVARALELGLSELGVCDHLVPAAFDEPGYGVEHGRLPDYGAAVRAAAGQAGGLRLLLGLEVDFVPATGNEIVALLNGLPLDYAVLSVHLVDGFDLADDGLRDDERWGDVDRVFRRYYELLAQAAAWAPEPAAVVGHPDLPSRFGHVPSRQPKDEQDAALGAIAGAGLALELNTDGSSWPGPGGDSSRWLLRRAHELGVPLTLGSDAHVPHEVGAGFADAVGEAHAAGYSTWLRLSDRQEVPLP